MKITYFSYLYDVRGVSAGSANKAIGFIRGLNEIGHNAKVYWRSVQPQDITGTTLKFQLRDRLKRYFSRYLHDAKRLAENYKYYQEELKILADEKPDILLVRSNLYNFSALAAAQKLGVPVVVEADCPCAYEHRHMCGRDKLKLGSLPERIERWNWQNSDAIITITNNLKNFILQSGIDEKKVTVVPNGADPERFKPGTASASLRAQFPVEDKVVIGWIGSWSWTGLENLLQVAKRILQERPQAVFLFVGGGQNQELVQRTFPASEIGRRVLMTGTINWDDVPPYVDLMDITIAPYPKLDFFYPSSMKVFEYMSAQKTVIASRIGQIAEVIQDGENGLLFNPEDMDDLAQKILVAIDDPLASKRMAAKARKDVLEKYTWTHQAQVMSAVFERVLAARLPS